MLTDTKVRNANPRDDGKALLLTDGRHGLALRVRKRKSGGSAKSWIQQLRDSEGKRTYMGLGSYPVVSLREARETAIANLARVHRGEEVRTRQKSTASGNAPTFADAYEAYMAQREFGSSTTERQWNREPRNYLLPAIGKMRITEIAQKDIVAILKQPQDDRDGQILWTSKPAVADRLLVYVRKIFGSLVASEQLEGSPVSADIRNAFPDRPKRPDDPYNAVPVGAMPEAMAAIINFEKATTRPTQRPSKPMTMRKLAAVFTILTAARTIETREAHWAQLDVEQARWRLHGENMKEREAHNVPLPAQALAIAAATAAVPWRKYRGEPKGLLFSESAGDGNGKLLPENALLNLIQKDCGLVDEDGEPATMHGFRSSFSMWAAENGYDSELREVALSHRVRGAVKGAYMRSDLYEPRRKMMQEWADFCLSSVDEPSALRALYDKIAAGA